MGTFLISGCISEEKSIKTEAPTTSPAISSPTPEQTAQIQITIQPSELPKGTSDPDIIVDIYNPDKAWTGTTLFADLHKRDRPRIIEVNMQGEIIWEYRVPENLKRYTNPGFDTERLPDNNILFVLPRKGVYEINRNGTIIWSYTDSKVSHDADRLPNGNTIMVWGGGDKPEDAQVKEVNQKGEIVWTWYAKDHFYTAPYKDIFDEGWTHTNAVTRLPDGNTLISLRNFDFVAEVEPQGSVVNTYGKGIFVDQHDPEIQPNGNILATSFNPPMVVEIDTKTNKIVWKHSIPRYSEPGKDIWPVRDVDRLPNGNSLITGSSKLVEVTNDGETVWQLSLKNIIFGTAEESITLGFYKADRINLNKNE
ncbi:MAG TPA: aryl-sulfate sulfotransferase [Candidatus Methanoperedens sp.]